MKRRGRLEALGRQIRGWLPVGPAAPASGLFDVRSALMVAAGTFFLIVGVFFLHLEQILGGPVYYVNCLPEMTCQGIEYNTSPVMPPFLVVFGILVIVIGLYYRSKRHNPHLPMPARSDTLT